MDDHDFHEAVREIPREPIPYFTQFGDKPQTISQMALRIPDADQSVVSPSGDNPEDHRTLTRNTVAEVTFDIHTPAESRCESIKSEGHVPRVSQSPVNRAMCDSVGGASTPMELPTRSMAPSSLALHTEEDYQQSLREERKRIEQQTLKRLVLVL